MRIIYITNSIFPYGSAYSIRLQNFGRLLSDLGHSVRILADTTSESFCSPWEIKNFERVSYQTISGVQSSYNRILNSIKSRLIIRKIFNNDVFDLIICGNTYDRFGLLKAISTKYRIPLILEIGEWYDTKSFRFHSINPYTYLYESCIKRRYYHVSGVIAISRLLCDHFHKLNIPVIRIPTILDFNNKRIEKGELPLKYKFIHVGFSGSNKEKFENILIALSNLKSQYNFEYHIYGSSYENVLLNIENNFKLIEDLKGCLYIHGRIPQDKISSVYEEADFSVFIRPDIRSSHAGFPTKLAESMYYGVPVIANNTGDIELYLNSKNGVLLENDTVEIIENAFIRLFHLNLEEIRSLRIQSLKTAAESFDYRKYSEEMKTFLESVKMGNRC